MKVRNFMIPAEKVVSCHPDDTIALAASEMLEKSIGSIIVLPREPGNRFPVGIVTKTNLLRGWQMGMNFNNDMVGSVMGTKIEAVLDTASRDQVAEHFEKTKHRHAFVLNDKKEYVGVVSAYDIAVEAAKDSKSWPYMNRDELAEKYKPPVSPKCASKAPGAKPHTFAQIAGANE